MTLKTSRAGHCMFKQPESLDVFIFLFVEFNHLGVTGLPD